MAQSHLNTWQKIVLPDDNQAVQETIGITENPASMLMAQYERIAREEMQGLPFYHRTMPILAECSLFEGQWLGVVLTPWMLSVVVLPGPDQCWPVRPLSSRLALQLPCGDLTFMVGELPLGDGAGRGQLLACSLMSPLDPHLGAADGAALVGSVHKMLLSLPVNQGEGAVDLGRRRLFGARPG